MMRFTIISVFVSVLAFIPPAKAATVSITPPDSLVIDGVNVTEGKFTLSLFANIQTSDTSGDSLCCGGVVPRPIEDPVIIGSGVEHTLFDTPEDLDQVNLMVFTFQPTEPDFGSLFRGNVVSAIPEFDISLPTTSLNGHFTEVIDYQGNRNFFPLIPIISNVEDPNAVLDIDLLGNGTIFVRPLPDVTILGNVNFQPHGSIRAVIPIPAGIWLFGSGLLALFGWKRIGFQTKI